MRDILNISLPKDLSKKVKFWVKRGRYSSKSEFFRHLLRKMIEEEEVLAELRKSQEEIRQGKGRLLRSLKDLR